MLRTLLIIAWTLVSGLSAGCKQPEAMAPFQPRETAKDYGRPLPPGELALRKIAPEQYPDFSRGYYEQAGLREAVEHSLSYMAKPSSQRYFPYGDISHSRAVASLNEFLRTLDEAQSAEQFDLLITQRFDVYQSVGWDGSGTVFFTGYYCPIFDGRRERDAEYRYPLYGTPPDLVRDEDGRILGRQTANGIVPYYSRREIEERGRCAGLEVAWLKDPFEAYVVTVQGSAKLRLADGSLYELGYGGNNGHEYTPISRQMIDDGVIGRDKLSLQAMIAYFRQHPEDVQKYCWLNERFVFFLEAPGGPFGSINTPVTPYRTIATDKEVFPRACVAFVDTRLARVYEGRIHQLPFASFALDQDTGGAIRAAGRCDVFMGIGPTAEAVAGRTGAEGGLYYVFVKDGASAQTPDAGG
ncbi:MAG: MltA domain-containing protein [Phycisphaerae bacterium]|nr:MltA domain-containing protein [Phycisphaerae bacterium]